MESEQLYTAVIIEWHDAHAYSEHWISVEEVEEEQEVELTNGLFISYKN